MFGVPAPVGLIAVLAIQLKVKGPAGSFTSFAVIPNELVLNDVETPSKF
jgi:hypothetical protein